MSIGPFQILIIALVILVLFGRGRISEMMGDFGKGVKSFRQGIGEQDSPAHAATPSQQIEGLGRDVGLASEAADSKPADKTAS